MLQLETMDITLGKGTQLERKVLNQLTLHVKEGEFVVVIGVNGAGKSTMFNAISGSITPDAGRIWMAGQDMTQTSQTHRAQWVSQVVQDPKVGTMENMTILENMAFAFQRGGKRGFQLFAQSKRIDIFKENLRVLNMGLEHRMDERVSNLSGGQRQALSIAMAMVRESKILLMDEITAALDPASREAIMELTHDIVRSHKLTCMMTTHNMAHALTYGDRLLVLREGRFVKEYSVADKSRMTPAELILEFGEMGDIPSG